MRGQSPLPWVHDWGLTLAESQLRHCRLSGVTTAEAFGRNHSRKPDQRQPRRLALKVPEQAPPSAWNVPSPEVPVSLPVYCKSLGPVLSERP